MLAQAQPRAHEERARRRAVSHAQLQQQRPLLVDANLAALHPRANLRRLRRLLRRLRLRRLLRLRLRRLLRRRLRRQLEPRWEEEREDAHVVAREARLDGAETPAGEAREGGHLQQGQLEIIREIRRRYSGDIGEI